MIPTAPGLQLPLDHFGWLLATGGEGANLLRQLNDGRPDGKFTDPVEAERALSGLRGADAAQSEQVHEAVMDVASRIRQSTSRMSFVVMAPTPLVTLTLYGPTEAIVLVLSLRMYVRVMPVAEVGGYLACFARDYCNLGREGSFSAAGVPLRIDRWSGPRLQLRCVMGGEGSGLWAEDAAVVEAVERCTGDLDVLLDVVVRSGSLR